ncbi:hypothetical protein [Acanthopleuribacter pedis]|uniref:Uncharacterized protein n=1 Tax=Acanthopleuribacter pedis TaxID=442870 RepID=A0A8J7Q7W2_9BACT|nr:hypothetical protein [Acanthopleuribacter pedis]MBO1319257.1 hypothetical protein [Acanthopleuribacter pedis]
MTHHDPWLNVPLNEGGPNPMSPPDPGPTFRGIVITAPERVVFRAGEVVDDTGAFAAIPVCAYHCFDVPAVPIDDHFKMHAVEVKSGKSYEGFIVALDPGIMVPCPFEDAEPLKPEDVEGLASGGWINPNLANFVPIPREPATYEVFMSLRGFQSNRVRIELIQE